MDENGLPLKPAITPGQAHDITVAAVHFADVDVMRKAVEESAG